MKLNTSTLTFGAMNHAAQEAAKIKSEAEK